MLKIEQRQKMRLQPYLVAASVGLGVLFISAWFIWFNMGPNAPATAGQEVRWIGTNNTDWQNPNNWANQESPDDNAHIIIAAGSHSPELSSSAILTMASLTLEEGASIKVHAGIRVKDNLSLEPNANLQLANGFIEAKNHVILQHGSKVSVNNATLQCGDDLTINSALVELVSSKAKCVVHDDIELKGTGNLQISKGDVEVKGDVDFIYQTTTDAPILALSTGTKLAVEGNLRFYATKEHIETSGGLIANDADITIGSIARKGQDRHFYSKSPKIKVDGGITTFTQNTDFEKDDDLQFSNSRIVFEKVANIALSFEKIDNISLSLQGKATSTFLLEQALASLQIQGKPTLQLEQDLRVFEHLEVHGSPEINGAGTLRIAGELTKLLGSAKLQVAHLQVEKQANLLLQQDVEIQDAFALYGSIDAKQNTVHLGKNCKVENVNGSVVGSIQMWKRAQFTFPFGTSLPSTLQMQSAEPLTWLKVSTEAMSNQYAAGSVDGSVKTLIGKQLFRIELPENERNEHLNFSGGKGLAMWYNHTWTQAPGIISAKEAANVFTFCETYSLPTVNARAERQSNGAMLEWDEVDASFTIKEYRIIHCTENGEVELAVIPFGKATKFFQNLSQAEKAQFRIDVYNADGQFVKGHLLEVGAFEPNMASTPLLVELYPNPIRQFGHLKISGGNGNSGNYTIVSMQGQVMDNVKIALNAKNQQQTVDFSALAPGQYVLKVQVGAQREALHFQVVR